MDLIQEVLFPSRTRRSLLVALFRDGADGRSVSELARRAGLTPRAVSVEVARLDAAGLVTVEAVGPANLVRPRADHPAVPPLRALLGAPEPTSAANDEEAVRCSLAAHGAPLFGDVAPRPLPLEQALLGGLALARKDAHVFLALPAVLSRRAGEVAWQGLKESARRLKLKAELGLLIDLTADVAGAPALRHHCAGLADGRRRIPRLLPSAAGAYERRLAELRSPEAARRWNFLVNLTEQAFRAACDAGPAMTQAGLAELFRAVDAELADHVSVTLAGSAALALQHPVHQAPSTIDLAQVEGAGFDDALRRARASLPESPAPRPVTAPLAPAEWRTRVVPVGPAGLRRLRVVAPERHDLALMRVASGLAHDLQSVEELHRAAPLRLGVLLSRYFEVDERLVPEPEAFRLSFLAVVERLFGAGAAARTEAGLGGHPRGG